MMRIVFATELESSDGWLRRSLPIAEHLRACGDTVAFVVADAVAANTLLTPKEIPFVPAPRFVMRRLSPHRAANYWQILTRLGEDDLTAVRARVRAWLNLFGTLSADAIGIDFAPTALLAAWISRRPVRFTEPAVTLPSAEDPAEGSALEHVNTIVRALDGPPLNRLADLFAEVHSLHYRMPVGNDRLTSDRLPDDQPDCPQSRNRRRILYAWELGANAGHLERGLAIAEALRDRGHEVTFVVRDLMLAEQLLVPAGFGFLPTPSTRSFSPRRPAINYSDLLLTCGFDDAAALGSRVRAWTHLLRNLAPDTIVIDHAPTAQLAAYVVNLPSILVGSGFSIPPLAQPLPSIQPHVRITTEQLRWADRRVLMTVNDVVRQFAAPMLSHPSELFARSTQIITTFKQLDTYSGRNCGTHVGPVERVTAHANTQWRTVGRARVFAYLRSSIRGLDALLESLRAYDGEVKCVLPGAAPATVARYQRAHFEIFTEPIELSSLLKETDVVISYGSAGLLAQALLAGVPLLLLADVLEQIINSTRVVELGAGVVLLKNRDPSTITHALQSLLSQERYRVAARAFAARYRGRASDAHERIVRAIEQSC